MLSSITDIPTLKEAIKETVNEYVQSVERLQKSRISQGVKEWVPFGISTLAAMPSLWASFAGNSPTALDLAVGAGGLVQLGVALYEKVNTAKHENDLQRSQRLLAGIRTELLDYRLLRKLVLNRD